MLVTGLFANASDAEIALNNLDEAGFEAARVSVIAGDPKQAAALSDTKTPLSGLAPAQLVNRLMELGLPADECTVYGDALARGTICLAVSAPDGSEAAAREILADQKANHTLILHGDIVAQ